MKAAPTPEREITKFDVVTHDFLVPREDIDVDSPHESLLDEIRDWMSSSTPWRRHSTSRGPG